MKTGQSEKEKDENQISVVSYNIRGWNDPDGKEMLSATAHQG